MDGAAKKFAEFGRELQNPILGSFAQQSVLFSDHICAAIEVMASGKLEEYRPSEIDQTTWVRGYSARRAILTCLAVYGLPAKMARRIVPFFYPVTKSDIQLLQKMSRRLTSKRMRVVQKTVEHLRADMLASELDVELITEKDFLRPKESFEDFFEADNVAAWFCYSVLIPCLIIHGCFPSQLLMKATNVVKPDFDALEDLARLDSYVRHHRRVRRLSRHANKAIKSTANEILNRQYPPLPVSRRSIKVHVAALIAKISDVFRLIPGAKGLSVSKIGELFDLKANVDGFDRDPDIHSNRESFAKEVQRKKKAIQFLNTDNFGRANVRAPNRVA